MEPLVYRLLIAALAYWLVKEGVAVFGIGDPPAWLILLIAYLLAILFVIFGWYLRL